jgi:hypothetical protein
MAESCLTAAGAPDDSRRSKYPMISVEDAIVHVLRNSSALSLIQIPLMEVNNSAVSVRVKSQFETSILIEILTGSLSKKNI